MTLVRTVKLGDWEFWVEVGPQGMYVSVPDCGGMMDSLPRVPEQLAWAESAFAELPALRQVWSTTWQLPAEAAPDLRTLIETSGGSWEEVDIPLHADSSDQ
jgi:hypothetical protein